MIAKDKARIVSLIATIMKDPQKVASLSPTAKKEISTFVGDLYYECTKGKILPANISLLLHEPKSLIRFTSQLIAYRAALGEIGTHQKLFDESYEKFIEQSEFFKKSLHNGNPFTLRIHLVHIHHLAKSDKASEEQKKGLACLLVNTQNYIDAMSSAFGGKFKLFVDGYAKYIAAFLLDSLKDKSGELVYKVEQLYLASQSSLEMIGNMPGSDTSMTLYGHQDLAPFADSDELIDAIKMQTRATLEANL